MTQIGAACSCGTRLHFLGLALQAGLPHVDTLFTNSLVDPSYYKDERYHMQYESSLLSYALVLDLVRRFVSYKRRRV